MKRRSVFPLALLLIGLPASAAEVVSPAPEAASLVIYPGRADGPYSGLALIIETRTVDLPAGPSVIRFRRVADTIVPQTADIDGLPAPVSERDFDYALLTPGSLLKSAVDQQVQVVRTNPKTGHTAATPAVIRVAPDGVVLQTAEGIEALGCSGLPERIVFDRLPPGLSDKPTLSARVVTPSAGRYRLTLRYLASGFGWRADYVAHIRPDGRTLDLLGWLTLQNQSGDTLADAPTEVVAGRLNVTGEDRPVETAAVETSPDCWNMASWEQRMRGVRAVPESLPPPPPPPPMLMAPVAARSLSRVAEVIVTAEKRSNLGDYKLYTLNEPTTVAAQQTKQIGFLRHEAVPFEAVYAFHVDAQDGTVDSTPAATQMVLKLRNTIEQGLGEPLPAGGVAVSAPGPGERSLLIGQTDVRDTPVGLPWRLPLGASYAVEVAPRVVAYEHQGKALVTTIEATLTNARGVPVTIELRHTIEPGTWRVTEEPLDHTIEAGEPQWTILLAAGEQRVFRYQVSQRN